MSLHLSKCNNLLEITCGGSYGTCCWDWYNNRSTMMADLHKDPRRPQHNCFLSQIVRPIVQSVRLYVTIQQEWVRRNICVKRNLFNSTISSSDFSKIVRSFSQEKRSLIKYAVIENLLKYSWWHMTSPFPTPFTEHAAILTLQTPYLPVHWK